MRLIRGFGGMLVLAVAFNACFKAPEFPAVPEITYNDIVFRDVSNPASADTLIITVNFRDGDGDLGLDDSETGIPYNDKYYYRFSDGSYLNYEAKRTIAGFDTLPDFVTPYNCTNWDVITDGTTGKVVDTLYFTLNLDHYNFFVDFYVQQPDQSFALYDWKEEFIYPNCQVNGFNGRFPILFQRLIATDCPGRQNPVRYEIGGVQYFLQH